MKLLWLLLIAFEQDRRSPIHFRYANYRVGDAHPFHEDGVTTVNFLYKDPAAPKEWRGAQARSKDLLHWEIIETTHAKPRSDDQKLPEYYVRGIVRDGSTYRTYYSNYGVRSSVGADLKRWDFSEPHKMLDRPNGYGRAPAEADFEFGRGNLRIGGKAEGSPFEISGRDSTPSAPRQ